MTPEMIAFQICVQARCPVHLWGEPGIGKSVTTNALAEALAEHMWTVILSIREPSDQGGLPVIVRHPDGSSTVWMAPPRWAKELVDEGKGIVHFDEMNVSAPTVMNSALRVINEGWAGDEKLPDDTSFVMCGNPPETNPGVYDLTPALANRTVHIQFPIDHEGWCDGMIDGWHLSNADIVKLPANWRKGIPKNRAHFSSFIRRRGQLLFDKPTDPVAAGKAWPSPRMWTMAGDLCAAAAACGHDIRSEVTRILIAGCVGETAATEFGEYIVTLDLRDPEEYLADPDNTELPRRQDQLMATIDQVAATALIQRPVKEMVHRYKMAWRLIRRYARMNRADVAVPAARILVHNMPEPLAKKQDIDWEGLEDILPILQEAGVEHENGS